MRMFVVIFAYVALHGMQQDVLSSVERDWLIKTAHDLQERTGVVVNLSEMFCSSDITPMRKALYTFHQSCQEQNEFIAEYDAAVNSLKKEYLMCNQYNTSGTIIGIAALKRNDSPFIVVSLVDLGFIFTKKVFVFTQYQCNSKYYTIESATMGTKPYAGAYRFYYYPSALCLLTPHSGILDVVSCKNFSSVSVGIDAKIEAIDGAYKTVLYKSNLGIDVLQETSYQPYAIYSYLRQLPLHAQWISGSPRKLMLVTYQDMSKTADCNAPHPNVLIDSGKELCTDITHRYDQCVAINEKGIIAYSTGKKLTFLRPKYPSLLAHYESLPFLQKFLLAYYFMSTSHEN